VIAQRQSGTGFRKLDAHHRAHQVDAAIPAVRARSKGNYEDPDHEADQDGHEHQLDTAVLGRGRHPLIIYRGCNASITDNSVCPTNSSRTNRSTLWTSTSQVRRTV